MIPYAKHEITNEDINAVVRVMKSGVITRGDACNDFSIGLAEYIYHNQDEYWPPHICTNGSHALWITAKALNLQSGDKVLCTNMSYIATANAIISNGATPIFIDVNDEGNISFSKIQEYINENGIDFKAIYITYMGGIPLTIDDLVMLQQYRKQGVKIVIDAAHALGSEYENGLKVGDETDIYSDMTIFSLHPSKTITSGEGGIIIANNLDYHMIINGIINNSIGGTNGHLSDLNCVLGLSQLNRINSILERRKYIVNMYINAGLDIIGANRDQKLSWHLVKLKLKNVKSIEASCILADNGYQCPIHYKQLSSIVTNDRLEQSTKYEENTIALPCHHDLTIGDMMKIIDICMDF